MGATEAVQIPTYEVLPTLHGPLALLVDGAWLVADQGSREANDEVARQAAAARDRLLRKA